MKESIKKILCDKEGKPIADTQMQPRNSGNYRKHDSQRIEYNYLKFIAHQCKGQTKKLTIVFLSNLNFESRLCKPISKST